jgi:hypothetical protein
VLRSVLCEIEEPLAKRLWLTRRLTAPLLYTVACLFDEVAQAPYPYSKEFELRGFPEVTSRVVLGDI